MAKICITSIGSDLDSPVDPRFGRCQFFLVVDEKGKLIKAIENAGVQAMRGAGITAAQIVANEKVDTVITGNIGPNAFMVLNQTGIKVYPGALGLTCRQAFEEFNQGKLTQAQYPLSPRAPRGGFGGGGRPGPGRGRSGRRGQRRGQR